jgi:hypothetical protein
MWGALGHSPSSILSLPLALTCPPSASPPLLVRAHATAFVATIAGPQSSVAGHHQAFFRQIKPPHHLPPLVSHLPHLSLGQCHHRSTASSEHAMPCCVHRWVRMGPLVPHGLPSPPEPPLPAGQAAPPPPLFVGRMKKTTDVSPLSVSLCMYDRWAHPGSGSHMSGSVVAELGYRIGCV